jgi:hypothetical protein
LLPSNLETAGEQKQQFFERALSAGLAPPWPYSEPLFSLPASDERVIKWLDQLRKFQIDPDVADSATLRLFRKFTAP